MALKLTGDFPICLPCTQPRNLPCQNSNFRNQFSWLHSRDKFWSQKDPRKCCFVFFLLVSYFAYISYPSLYAAFCAPHLYRSSLGSERLAGCEGQHFVLDNILLSQLLAANLLFQHAPPGQIERVGGCKNNFVLTFWGY